MAAVVRLYDVPVSSDDFPSRGLRVLWALHETGASFVFRATFPRRGRVPPEFPALNPSGQVPALTVGGSDGGDGLLVMSESTPMAVFLARKYAPALYPFPTPEGQARADRLLYFASTTMEDVALKLIFTHGNISRECYSTQPHSPECFQWGCRLWRSRVLPTFASFLQSDHIMGSEFTVVDIAVAYPLIYMRLMGFLEESFTGSDLPYGNDRDEEGAYSPEQQQQVALVRAYLERVTSRSAFQQALRYNDSREDQQ